MSSSLSTLSRNRSAYLATAIALLLAMVTENSIADQLRCTISESASPLSNLGHLKPGGLSDIWLKSRGDTFHFDDSTGRLRWGGKIDVLMEIVPAPVPGSNDLIATYAKVGTGRVVHRILRVRTWKKMPLPFVFLEEEEILSGSCVVTDP